MRLPLQQSDVQAAAGAPLALGDTLEPRGHEHEHGLAVGEGAHDPRPATMAWMAFSIAATLGFFDLGTLASTFL